MKISLLAVVVLTAAVALSAAADPECVYRKIRDLPMHWANPSDCGRFYRCTNKNVKREVICPGDKEYNAKTGKCANGGRGLCKLSLNAPLAAADNVCATEVSGAYLPQTGNCRNYYICNEKQAFAQACPAGSYFDVTSTTCIPDPKTTCWQNKCIGVTDGSYLANAPSCQTFLICANDQAVEQTCGAGSYFDTTTSNCNPDLNNEICWENYCTNVVDGVSLKDATDCNAYYECAGGKTIKKQCPEGSYFDTKALACAPGDCPAEETTTENPIETTTETTCEVGETTTEEIITEEPTTEEATTEEPTTEEATTEEACTEEATTEEASTEEATTEEACTEEATTEEASTEVASTEEACKEEATTEEATTEEATTEVSTTEDATTEEATTEVATTEDATTEEQDTTTTETSNPETCTCPGGYDDGEFVPHPDNCQLFYICSDGHLIETSCQARNYFEPTVNACLPDTENKCPQCTETTTRSKRSIDSVEDSLMSDGVEHSEHEHESAVSTGTALEVIATCLGIYHEGQFVAHPTECHKFQVCYGGELIVQDCGLGMYFDGTQHFCQVDTENLCAASKPIVQVSEVMEVAAAPVATESCTCPGGYAEGDMLPHPSDCDKYYICYDGQLVEYSCGKGNYFNKLTTACAADTTNSCWPADCGGTNPEPEPENICIGQANNIMVPNPYKCDAFYFCMNGVATAESCYAGEWFDPAAAACVVDVNAECINPCVNTTGITFLPHPDCLKYYFCNNGQTHVENCAAGTAFDEVRGICSASVTCAGNLCTNQPDGTTFPVDGNTSSFYYCLSGVPTLLHCEADYGFNAAVGVCLPQPSTDCTQATCTTGEAVPPFTTISGDMGAFCYCMNNAAYKESCQDTYVFNPALQICYSNAPCDPEICDDMPEYTISANRNDTQSFCLCVTNIPIIIDCPFNGTFNALAGSCKPAPVADPNCDQNFCLYQPQYTTYPALNGMTGAFCLCEDQVGTLQICEGDTIYSPNYQICLPPGVGDACNVAECAVNPNAIFPAVNDPYSFCYCTNETTVVERQCPTGEKFNTTMLICLPEPCNTQWCLNPNNANSGMPFPANNYPYGFCLCNGNEPVLHTCEGGFVFDPTHLICLPEVDEQCNLALCQNASPTNQYPTPTISDPDSFCYCFGPTSVQLFNCPAGLSYDITKQICLNPNESPIDDGCTCPGGYKEGQFLAHPTNCQKFYICSGGVLHETDCGSGNYFSKASDACVAKTTNGMFSASSAATCVGAYHEGDLVPHHSDRKRYFVCYRAQLVERTCGSANVFDAQRLTCVRETTATKATSMTSGGRWKQRTAAAVSTTGDLDDFRCIDNEKRSVPANCSQYEICIDGRWKRRTCTEQRYYNPEQQKCLEPRDDTICAYAKVSDLPACNNATEGIMQPGKSTNNCAQYYRCTHGKWRLRACAKQQYYSRQVKTCIAASVDIGVADNSTLDLCDLRNKAELSIEQKGCRHTAVRAYNANCGMYLMCLEDEWWYHYCPLGMYFSRAHNYCMPNDAGQCIGVAAAAPATAPANTTAVEVTLEFAAQNCSVIGALRPSALACDKYYVCMNGHWHQQSCPQAHYYNVTAEACIRDADGVCAALTTSVACVTNERRAFPLNCSAYEECRADGMWQRLSCPPTTAFDDVLLQCVNATEQSCASSGLRRVCQQGEIRRSPLAANCTEFYHCQAESWHKAECLKGYTFAADFRMCVQHAADDRCRAAIQTAPVDAAAAAVDEEVEDITCVGRDDSVTLPHASDCSRFYLCLGEAAIEQACPRGSFYDTTVGYCRPNDGAICRLPLTGACADASYGEFVAHPEDCQAYYNCSAINGTQLLYCPTGEYYHAYMRQCRVDHGECVGHSGQTPEERKCAGVEHGTRLPHELYCNIYYACVRGMAFPVECPDQHQFNAVLGRCLYDELEQCQNGQLVNGTTPYSCGNLTNGSYLPDRADCSRYYICSESVALPQRCNSGAFFDAQQLLCLPDDGSCPFVDQPNNQTVPPDPIMCVGKHGILMPDPANCNEFYVCVNGKLRHERCYADKFFNVTLNQCQSYDRVPGDLDDFETTAIDQLKVANGKATQCSDSPTDFNALCGQIPPGSAIAEQGDCRFYISCQDDAAVPVSQRCRNGESFDSLLGFCRQNDGTCSLENGQRVGECNGRHGQLVRDADNCRGYFVCINGQKIGSECAADEYFNRTQNICLKDVAMQCNSKLPANIENASGVSCIGLSESVLYPYTHDRCRSYFQCVKGVPKIHECADGLFFDAASTRCVKEIGECAMPTATSSLTATTTAQNLQRAPDAKQPSNVKICAQALLDKPYPNLLDQCRSYYTCLSDGSVLYTICPDGTLFNAASGDCVEAANVICGMTS